MSALPLYKKAPFIRLLLPLILGIFLQYYLQFLPAVIYIIGGSAVMAVVLFSLLSLSLRHKFEFVQGILLQVVFISLGAFLTYIKDVKNNDDWVGNNTGTPAMLLQLRENGAQKTNSVKAEADVIAIRDSSGYKPAAGKVIIYFEAGTDLATLQYGKQFLLQKPLQKIKNSGNPGAFDYERYAGFHQIYHTVYLTGSDYTMLDARAGSSFKKLLLGCKEKVLSIIARYIPGDDNVRGIAEALLIGEKQHLDIDLVEAYSQSGVVHLIAISGMHLGIVYGMIVLLFMLIPRWKHSTVKVVITILILWLFALATGGSPSVVRSALMFSLMIIGKQFFKSPSVYNNLSASAFILLCINPWYLWDVGFQLSYLAVTSIVWLQDPIYRLLFFKNKIANAIWKLATVSIAAQIVVFPITVFYFHQFPSLFIITNLLAFPLMFVILNAGIILLLLSWWPAVAAFIGKVIFYGITLMNAIVQGISGQSFSVVDNFSNDAWATIILYGFVLGMAVALTMKKRWAFYFSLGCLVLFAVNNSVAVINANNTSRIVLYNVRKHTAVDFITNSRYDFIGDSAMREDGALRNFNLKPARIFYRANAESETQTYFQPTGRTFVFRGKTVFLADAPLSLKPIENKLPIDILVITKDFKGSITKLTGALAPVKIVADGTVARWRRLQLREECVTLGLAFHDVQEDGAFVLEVE